MELEKYMKVSTAAKDLGVSPQWVYTLMENKTINSQSISNVKFVVIDGDYDAYKKWKTRKK